MANIDTLELDIIVKNDNAVRRINAITKAIEKLNTAMGKSGDIDKVIDKLNNVSPTSTRGGSTSKGGSSKTSKNLNAFATLGKWNYMVNMARYYGRTLANIVQLSMDYVETQNLWQVANRNNLQMADEFIQKMNKAYGVSEATLMNYQAIFKNMLSALGDLSDEVSSGLSMQLTQMALDFSSLYNVSIPSAMQKFQAVLSGQVRPIRSISGYDITENTIFDLYAGAGGQKTMRQLSQIEKRLLRIVAVFDQMGETGAIGDLAKTIDKSASNQARIMAEQTQEVAMWTGQVVLMWLNNAKVLQHINAALITAKEIIKSVVYSMGYQEENFLDGLMTSAEGAEESVDKLQGKLTSFDKFEALNSNQDNILGIDQTVLNLLEKINYETEEFTHEAQLMAEQWLTALGFVDENGDGVYEITQEARNLLDVINAIGSAISLVLGFKLADWLANIALKAQYAEGNFNLLNSAILGGAVYAIIKAVEAFKEGDTWGGILATTIGIGLVTSFILLNKQMFITIGTKIVAWFQTLKLQGALATTAMDKFRLTMTYVSLAVAGIVAGFSLFDMLLSSLPEDIKPIVATLGLVAAAATGVAVAFMAMHGIMSWGVAVPIITGAVGVGIASIKGLIAANTPAYATGGFPEDGLFFANSGEMVGKFSNGKTAVANNDQIVAGISKGVYDAIVASGLTDRDSQGLVLRGDRIDDSALARAIFPALQRESKRLGGNKL